MSCHFSCRTARTVSDEFARLTLNFSHSAGLRKNQPSLALSPPRPPYRVIAIQSGKAGSVSSSLRFRVEDDLPIRVVQ